jgi:hypothetical protein
VYYSYTIEAESIYDANNYARAELYLASTVWDLTTPGAGDGGQVVATLDNDALVSSSVSYGYIDTSIYAVAYGFYLIDNNPLAPTAGEATDSATATFLLGIVQQGSHSVGNPTYGATLYASVVEASDISTQNGLNSFVLAEPLDSDGLYYSVVGELQQATSSDPTADSDEIDDVVLLEAELYGGSVAVEVGQGLLARMYVFEDDSLIEVGSSTSDLTGTDARDYSAQVAVFVNVP